MHPLAARAAEAARCAAAQGKFWEYHDALFQNKKLQLSDLKQQAKDLKLDTASFDKCLDSGEQTAAVKADSKEGLRLGLVGTPSFFVNGHFLSGSVGYAKLRETVLQELNAQKQSAALAPAKEAEKNNKVGSPPHPPGDHAETTKQHDRGRVSLCHRPAIADPGRIFWRFHPIQYSSEKSCPCA